MIYVYALLEPSCAITTAPAGIEGTRVEHRAHGDIVGAISDCGAARPSPTAENVWAHEGVVEALMERCTVLPVRFGTIFTNHEQLESMLDRHAAELARGFERVRGCVELGVRVAAEATALQGVPEMSIGAGKSNSGRGYMDALAAAERDRAHVQWRTEQLVDSIHRPLAAIAREGARREGVSAPLLFSAAYLVEGDKVDEFRRCVDDLSGKLDEVKLLCTGPWPPYNFVPRLAIASSEAIPEKTR
jgi:hypothetical protein